MPSAPQRVEDCGGVTTYLLCLLDLKKGASDFIAIRLQPQKLGTFKLVQIPSCVVPRLLGCFLICLLI